MSKNDVNEKLDYIINNLTDLECKIDKIEEDLKIRDENNSTETRTTSMAANKMQREILVLGRQMHKMIGNFAGESSLEANVEIESTFPINTLAEMSDLGLRLENIEFATNVEHDIMNMLDGKIKRNKNVFDLAAAEMAKKGHMKSGAQIKDKFKNLKRDYLKIKRNNNKSGSQRHSSQYFDLIDEILGHRPCASTEGIDTSDNMDDIEMEVELLEDEMEESEFIVPETLTELDATSSQPNRNKDTTVFEFPATSQQNAISQTATQQTSTSQSETDQPPISTFKRTNKKSNQKVIGEFTQEWKNTQEEMINKMKEQDENFLETMENQMKEEREILKEHREETFKMMENDRKDMMGMFNAFLKTMKQQRASVNIPQYGTFLQNAQITSPANVLFTPIASPTATPNGTLMNKRPKDDFDV